MREGNNSLPCLIPIFFVSEFRYVSRLIYSWYTQCSVNVSHYYDIWNIKANFSVPRIIMGSIVKMISQNPDPFMIKGGNFIIFASSMD
jgi:hypothetical protein